MRWAVTCGPLTDPRPHARRRVGWGVPAALVGGLIFSCVPGLRAEPALAIDPAKRRAITDEVLASQRDPRGRAEKIEALRAYERFIMEDLGGRSALKAEALHRLGDLYTEIEIAAAARRARDDGKRKGTTRGAVTRTKSIAVYERLLALYPERADNDGALYQLARAYEDAGRSDEAAARLLQLHTRYPRSRYAPEAAFRLGRRAFAARDFRQADDLFTHARRGADPELIKGAAYYLGWTALNRQEYRRAADAFASILDAAARVGGRSSSAPDGSHAGLTLSAFSESEAAFLTDVINALLLSFDYVGGAKELRAYLDAAGRRPYEVLLYRTMGTLYQAQDRTADAVEAYTAFLEAVPLHPEAPAFQQAIVDAYTKAKWQKPLLEARERLIDRYGPEGDWARANGDASRQTARRLVKNALYELALYEHAQAQAGRRPETYERALARHERFLALFPRDIDTARVAWLRADALFELGRYAAAAAAYRQTAYEYPLHAQSREAGYAAVVAWERTLPADGAPTAAAFDGLLNHVNRFVNTFADDSRNPDLLMKVADTAARAALPRQAREAAQRLVADYPGSRWSGSALRLIGHTWYDQGEYAAAEEAFRRALAGAAGVQAETLSGLAAAALYQTAIARRSAGDTDGAGAAYLKVAGDFPSTPLAPAALHDAAEMRAAAGNATGAIDLWTRLAVEYPAAGQTPSALRKLAEAALHRQDRLQAIDWYDRLARRSDATVQMELAWTIADLAEQAEAWSRAERELVALAGRSDLPPARVIEAGFRAAHAAARRGNTAEARERTAVTLDRYHAWRAQHPAGSSLTAADGLAAAALMESADRLAAAATALRLSDPLERSLADKRAALNTALDAYAKIVEMKVGATATAATHKIGMLLDDFFQAVLDSDRPRDLTPEQLEQYDFLLEEQAAPFEDRAVAAYEANVRRTHRLGLYDEWIQRSFARLAVLRPARYRRPELGELMRNSPGHAP